MTERRAPESRGPQLERQDVRERARKDAARHRRRAPPSRFFRAFGLLGSVGWPIALLSLGGALLGRYLDARWHSGVRFTLMLLTIGATLGTVIALRSVRGDP